MTSRAQCWLAVIAGYAILGFGGLTLFLAHRLAAAEIPESMDRASWIGGATAHSDIVAGWTIAIVIATSLLNIAFYKLGRLKR